jgi:hypothetical protein
MFVINFIKEVGELKQLMLMVEVVIGLLPILSVPRNVRTCICYRIYKGG